MIRIYLLVIVLILTLLALRWFLKTPPARVAKSIKRTGVYFAAAALVILAGVGKLNWLFALFGVLIASVARALPLLLRYAPQLQRLWMLFRTSKNTTSNKGYQATQAGAMSREQAFDILGLKPGASKQDVILAHRKLMQKLHPDRGGSDYLAAQINQAKKVLLDS